MARSLPSFLDPSHHLRHHRDMSRLPFNDVPPSEDDGRGIPPSSRRRAASDKPMTVTDLAKRIKAVVQGGFPGKVRVVGEISNFSDRSHWFFSMKDEGANIRCVCFASSAKRVGFTVQDGMEVVATGRLDYYDAQGSVQLYVDQIEPVGQGTLELRFKQLCEELRQLGYFDVDRKKPLPVMPRRIAVVTSRSAAALQDVINTTSRRWPGCQLLLCDVRVQGESAAPEIAAAIKRLSIDGPRLGIDAIILTRGGGSMEDLWAFNERVVADAVFRCPLPIVAAIGHETDTTVAELVADLRCATPTQAAMTLVPDKASLLQQVSQLDGRMTMLLRRELQHARQRLDGVARHPFFRRPDQILQPARDRLSRLEADLLDATKLRLQRSGERLQSLTRHLNAIGPDRVLERGFTYTTTADGDLLKSAATVRDGQRITTVFADGKVNSVVGEGSGPSTPSPAPARKQVTPRKRKPKADDAEQGRLFG
jgi:exodeoxyribonuclease VII large subunit